MKIERWHERLRLCVTLARNEGCLMSRLFKLIVSMYKVSTDIYRSMNRKQKQSAIQEMEVKVNWISCKGETCMMIIFKKMIYPHAKEICKYVKDKYDIDYTVSGMAFWLKEDSSIRNLQSPVRLDPENQENFHESL